MTREIVPVVCFSGGLGSALAAVMLKEKGIDPILLHTDTKFESDDTYTFMERVASHLGLSVTYVADGRTPEKLFWDEHLLGNDLFPICSVILKANQCENWLMERRIEGLEPEFYVGILPDEPKRVERIRRQYEHMGTYPAIVHFPLVEGRDEVLQLIEASELNNETMGEYFQARLHIAIPSAYQLGFDHNNCRKQCVRAGLGHYYNLYWKDNASFQEARDREFRFCVEVYPSTRKSGGKPAIDANGFPTVTYLKRRGQIFSLMEMEAMILQGWKPGLRDWTPTEELRPCICQA